MADGSGWGTLPSRAALPVIINPEAAVAHRGWCEARDAVLRAVAIGPRLILILGAPGSGKSLLLRELATRLRDGFDVLLLARGDRLVAETAPDGRPRVVLIDQAWRLTEAALAGLARLGECTVVLTGLPDRRAGQRLSDEAAQVVMLPPLGDDEIGGFVAERLARAGLPAELFGTATSAALAAQAGGQVKRLNMLMSAALDVAREHGVGTVGRLEVEQAARVLDQPAREPCAMPEAELVRPELSAVELPMAGMGGAESAAGAGWRSRFVPGGVCVAVLIAVAAGWLAQPTATRTVLLAPPAVTAPAAGLPRADIVPPVLDAAPASGIAAAPPHLAVEAPDGAAALSMAAPARVLLLVARGDAAAAGRASDLAMALSGRGFAAETRAVRAVAGAAASVRYFFAEDRGTAEAVLAAAGLPGRSVQATPDEAEAELRPGLIEIVLPAGGGPAVGETRTRLVQTIVEGKVP